MPGTMEAQHLLPHLCNSTKNLSTVCPAQGLQMPGPGQSAWYFPWPQGHTLNPWGNWDSVTVWMWFAPQGFMYRKLDSQGGRAGSWYGRFLGLGGAILRRVSSHESELLYEQAQALNPSLASCFMMWALLSHVLLPLPYTMRQHSQGSPCQNLHHVIWSFSLQNFVVSLPQVFHHNTKKWTNTDSSPVLWVALLSY
jgi:hypothetical protein